MEPCDVNITTYCLEEDTISGGGSGSLHVGVATAIIKALALQFFQHSSTSTPVSYVLERVWRRGLSFEWNGAHITLEWMVQAVRAQQISMGVTYGTFAVMLWDMFLTFSDEVAFIWPARFSFVKIVFLFNRYVTPIVIAVNLWTLSGHARNLSNTYCRVWFTLALLIESLGISCVSLVVALRLYAFQVATRRVLLFLLGLWALSLMSTVGLLIRNFLIRMDSIVFISSGKFSSCTATVSNNAWTSWLPLALEHGLLCVFLFLNALKTPRSSQTALLAIMYRQGIFFYAITFTLFCFALVVFRFMSIMWYLLPLYTTWILCQIFMSRLLIGVKTTQAFENFVPQLQLSNIAMKPRPSAHYHVPYPPHLQQHLPPHLHRQPLHQHHHHQQQQSNSQLQSQSMRGRGEMDRSPSAQSFRPSSITEVGTRASPMPSKPAGHPSVLHPYDSDPEIAVIPADAATNNDADEGGRRMSVAPQYPPPANAHGHVDPLSDDRDSSTTPPRSRSFWDRLPWWMRIGPVWQSVGGVPGGGVVGWGAVGPGGVTAVGLGGMAHHRHHHAGDLHVDIDCCDESDHEDVDDTIGNAMDGVGEGSSKEQKKTRGGLRVSKLGRYDYWL